MKKTSYNSTYPKGGVLYKLGALCFYSSSVLVDSFVLRNPPERKARTRRKVVKKLTLTFQETNFNLQNVPELNFKPPIGGQFWDGVPDS